MKDRFGIDWGDIQGSPFWTKPVIGRRMFFQHAATALGGYFLLPHVGSAATPIGKAKNCIFILMAGAPSHTDTFDLKEGPWTPAAFAPEAYGDLRFPRGLMPGLAEQIDSLALLRSVRAWAAVHTLAQTWIQIGRNPTSGLAKIAPHIGSVVAMELGRADALLPAFVSLNAGGGVGSGYFPPRNAPFYVTASPGGLANTQHPGGRERFEARYQLLMDLDAHARDSAEMGGAIAEMDSFNRSARNMMYSPEVDAAFRFTQEERTRYGASVFANACLTARNLLRARLGTRFIQITAGGWDNHSGIYAGPFNATNENSLVRQFDRGLASLIADLKTDGLLDETLIVALGEFGRTVGPLNSQNGRDHYLQQSVLFAGGNVKGGRAIGATDAEGRSTVEPGWSRERDVRPEDIEATIYSALGIDWTIVRRDDPLGRGFEYVPFADRDLYGPVHELWG
jgi:hypothetical protein